MDSLLLIFIKLLLSSALLVGFYLCLFRNKASFRASRLFLLTIPVFSFLFSVISIETENNLVQFSISELLKKEKQVTLDDKNLSTAPTVTEALELAKRSKQGIVRTNLITTNGDIIQGNTLTSMIYKVILSIYLFISVLLISVLFRQMWKMRKIHKNAIQEYIEGIPVYRSNEIPCSFSILKNIYVPDEVSDEKLRLIIQHEQQHILCYHYMDLILLEIMVIFMWFNPLLWFIRREIRAIHEYEADERLIKNGIKVREYMKAILEEMTGNIPLLANGFQGSLIKKRFMNMKNGNSIRMKKIRLVLTVPFFIILIGFLSCKSSQTEYSHELRSSKYENLKSTGTNLYEVRNSNGEFDLLWEDELAEKAKSISAFRVNSLPPTRIINVDTEGNYINDVTGDYPLQDNNLAEGLNFASHNLTLGSDGSWINPDGVALTDWTRDWVVRYNAKAISNKLKYLNREYDRNIQDHVINVDANKKETRITFATINGWDWCWRFVDKNTCLIDRATGDRYMIRDVEGDEELGRLSIYEGTNGKWFEITYIFPPLKKNVTAVDYYSPFNNIDAPVNHNGTEAIIPNILVNRFNGKIIR